MPTISKASAFESRPNAAFPRWKWKKTGQLNSGTLACRRLEYYSTALTIPRSDVTILKNPCQVHNFILCFLKFSTYTPCILNAFPKYSKIELKLSSCTERGFCCSAAVVAYSFSGRGWSEQTSWVPSECCISLPFQYSRQEEGSSERRWETNASFQ